MFLGAKKGTLDQKENKEGKFPSGSFDCQESTESLRNRFILAEREAFPVERPPVLKPACEWRVRVKNTHVKLIFLGILVLIFIGIVVLNGTVSKEPLAQKVNAENNQPQDVCSRGKRSTNYKDRVALLTECIDGKDFVYNSEHAIYFLKRGYGYERLKQEDLALNDYLKAIELNKNYADAYYNAGNIYFSQKKYDIALSSYSKSIELNPGDGLAYYNRGQVYKETGEYEKALADYDKTISLNKMKAESYLNRGFCLKKLKNYKNAFEEYSKAINENPKYAEAYNDRGYLYYQFKIYDAALADYNKALELNPNYSRARNNRLALYIDIGGYDTAFKELDKMVERDPTYLGKAYYCRGSIYRKMEDYDSSVQNYEKAIEIDPEFTWSYNNLAIIYYSSDDQKYRNPERAVDLLLKAMKISGPRVPEYNHSLAAAYARLGQFQKSVEYQTVDIDIAKERGWGEEKVKELQEELEAYENNRIPD